MFLPEFAVRRPITVLMIFIGILVLGVISFNYLAVDLLPDVSFPMVVVLTNYEGVGPQEVESMVTKTLERSLSTTKDLKNIYSYSLEDMSAILMEFDWSVNMDFAAMDVREKIDMVKSNLPEGVDNPTIIKFDPSMMPVVVLGVSSKSKDLGELRYLAEEVIEPRLEKLEGVAAASPMGGKERQIQVELNRDKLRGMNLSVNQILGAIGASNLDLPGGHMKFGQSDFLVRTTGRFKKPDELRRVIVSYQNNTPIYLGDVAEIRDDFKEKTSEVRVKGAPAVMLTVQKESRANTVKVADRVKKAITEIKKELPPDVEISIIMDSSVFIKQSIANVERSALEGGILAIIIILIFLRNFSSTLIISTAIPISVVATFILLYFGRLTLNIATMGGLALGIGRLVDDGIVVLESIFRHREKGDSPRDGSVNGANEVSMAVLAATITTIIVFVPIEFVTGVAGMLFKPMAYTVIFSLAVSYFVAMVLIPLLCMKFMKVRTVQLQVKPSVADRFFAFSQRTFDSIDDTYQRILDWALRHKGLVISGVVGMLLITLPITRFVGTEFMPQVDEGEFEMSVKLPVGTDLEHTTQVLSQIEKIVKDNVPEIQTFYVRAGVEGKGFGALSLLFSDITGPHSALIRVELVSAKQRKRSVFEIVELLRPKTKNIPDVDIKYNPSAGFLSRITSFGSTAPVLVEVRGYDLATSSALSQKVAEVVKEVPGSRDVKISREEGMPEYKIEIDRDKASALGLNLAQIASTVQTQLGGTVASFYLDPKLGKEFEILVRLREPDRRSLLDLNQIFIATPLGKQVPLSNLAKVVKTVGPVKIDRKSQERIVSVTCQVSGRPAGDVAREIESRIKKEISIPQEFSVSVAGSYQEQKDSFKVLLFALLLAVALVYMVMAAQFESLLDPFIVMFSVPLGIIGVIWGLFLTGKTLSTLSFLGIIMMAGIVVSNAILLVDYTNVLRKRGLELEEAVIKAGRTRLRPILMTSLATVMGLIPMALGIGEGAELWSPMGVTVISGLLVSMFLTLVLIPTLYAIVNKKAMMEGA
jgi:hydrophobic/amphiphilic exporter-1 (mainly G- bacteria), HAE1 family